MRKLIILLSFFICANYLAFSQDYSKLIEMEDQDTDVQVSLKRYYSWIETNATHNELFKVIIRVFELEKDLNKLLGLLINNKNNVNDPDEKYDLLYRTASLLELSGNIELAQQYYQEAAFISQKKESFFSLFNSAVLLYELGEYTSSMSQLKLVKESSGNSLLIIRSDILQIKNLLAENFFSEAKRLYTALIPTIRTDTDPGSLYVLWELSHFLGETKNAETITNFLTKAYPESLELKLIEKKINNYPSVHRFLFLKKYPEGPAASAEKPSQITDPGFIQIGSFADRENAEYRKKDADKAGFSAVIREVTVNNRVYYRLLIPVSSDDIQRMLLILKDKGFEGYPVY